MARKQGKIIVISSGESSSDTKETSQEPEFEVKLEELTKELTDVKDRLKNLRSKVAISKKLLEKSKRIKRRRARKAQLSVSVKEEKGDSVKDDDEADPKQLLEEIDIPEGSESQKQQSEVCRFLPDM